MTPDEVRALIARDEDAQVEFKLENEPQPSLAGVIAAMANASGGWILVGVDDTGEIKGVSRTKPIIDRFHSAAASIEPSLAGRVEVETVQLAEYTLVVAHVPTNLTSVYSVGGVYRIRIGSYSKLLTLEQAVALGSQRGALYRENMPLHGTPVTTLDGEHLDTYLQHRLRDYKSSDISSFSRTAILGMLGCTAVDQGEEHPTVAAALFFSSAADLFVQGAYILAARFAGRSSERVLDRQTIRGTLPEIIEQASDFIEKNIRYGLAMPQTRGDAMQAREVPEYPYDAYRELIVNLVAHRDYARAEPAHLYIFADRLELENPGGLLPGMTIATLENQHRTRNPRISEMLQTLGYVERFGSGLGRVRKILAGAGLPPPTFVADAAYFRVILHSTIQAEIEGEPIARIPQQGRDYLPEPSPAREDALLAAMPITNAKTRQVIALRHLIRMGRITNAEYRAVTSVSNDTTLTDLRELMRLGIVERRGETGKKVYYVLSARYSATRQ